MYNFWHAVSKFILLQYRYKKVKSKEKRKEKKIKKIIVVKSKARKTSLFNASCERIMLQGLRFRDFISCILLI